MILAQSAESVLGKARSQGSSLVRRSLSVDHVQDQQSQPNSPRVREGSEESDSNKTPCAKNRSIFRFSGKFRKYSDSNCGGAKNSSDLTLCQSHLLTTPPYPQSPPVYPSSPPPPFTPTVPEIHIEPSTDPELPSVQAVAS